MPVFSIRLVAATALAFATLMPAVGAGAPAGFRDLFNGDEKKFQEELRQVESGGGSEEPLGAVQVRANLNAISMRLTSTQPVPSLVCTRSSTKSMPPSTS